MSSSTDARAAWACLFIARISRSLDLVLPPTPGTWVKERTARSLKSLSICQNWQTRPVHPKAEFRCYSDLPCRISQYIIIIHSCGGFVVLPYWPANSAKWKAPLEYKNIRFYLTGSMPLWWPNGEHARHCIERTGYDSAELSLLPHISLCSWEIHFTLTVIRLSILYPGV